MPFIAPVVGAIISAGTAIGSFVGSLGAFGQMALSFGLNAVLGQIGKKQQQPAIGGVKLDVSRGGDRPREVACGLVGTAGQEVHLNTYGKSNKFAQQVIVLSDYYSTELMRVGINGEWVELTGSNNDKFGREVASGSAKDNVNVKFYDGRQIAAAPILTQYANPAERWAAANIGLGITFVILTVEFDGKGEHTFTSFPQSFFEFRGAPFYDRRKDSTAGGNGPHRWGDVATHEYTENPIVISENYRRGLKVNGDLFCGMEMTEADLPFGKWATAMNICDEDVDGEKRYAVSILLDCNAEHGDNLEALLLACGGINMDGVDGNWPLVGSNQPIVATIYDSDLVAGEPVRFRAKRSMSELVNSVSGTYPEPTKLWSMESYDQQKSATALAADRRTRDVSMNFPMVRQKRQANQLASIYLLENRFEGTGSCTLRPRWQALEIGDWVRWISPRFAHLGGAIVIMITESALTSLDGEGPRNNAITFQQRDGAIYAGRTADQVLVPVVPGAADYQNELQNYQLGQQIILSPTGSKRPALRATWAAIEDETIVEVVFEHRNEAQPDFVYLESAKARDTSITLTKGMVSETPWEVRYRFQTNPPRTIAPTPWEKITTPSGKLGPADVLLEALAIPPEVAAIMSRNISALRGVRDQLAELDKMVSDQDAANLLYARQLRTELKVTADNLSASFTDVITVYVQPLSTSIVALSNRTTILEAQASTYATATVVNQLDARVVVVEGGLASQASTLQGVTARLDDATADALLRMETVASSGGAAATISMQVRATTASGYADAGLLLQTMPNGSTRAVLKADQSAIIDSAGNVNALFVGGAYFNTAYIQNLTAASITLNGITYDRLAPGSITSKDGISGSGSGVTSGGGYVNMAVVTIFNPDTQPVLIDWSLTTVLQKSGGQGDATSGTRLACITTGEIIASNEYTAPSNTTGTVNDTKVGFALHTAAPQGNVQYAIQRRGSGNANTISGSGIVKLAWWKR